MTTPAAPQGRACWTYAREDFRPASTCILLLSYRQPESMLRTHLRRVSVWAGPAVASSPDVDPHIGHNPQVHQHERHHRRRGLQRGAHVHPAAHPGPAARHRRRQVRESNSAYLIMIRNRDVRAVPVWTCRVCLQPPFSAEVQRVMCFAQVQPRQGHGHAEGPAGLQAGRGRAGEAGFVHGSIEGFPTLQHMQFFFLLVGCGCNAIWCRSAQGAAFAEEGGLRSPGRRSPPPEVDDHV